MEASYIIFIFFNYANELFKIYLIAKFIFIKREKMERFFFLKSFMIPWHYSEYGVWRGVWVGPAGAHAQVRVDSLQGPVYRVLQFVHLLGLSTCRGKQGLESCR
jgi:hypothetical protein